MSAAAHCRIRRVRMKSGADVTVLHREEVGELGQTLMKHARQIAHSFGAETAGFFIVGWAKDGAYVSGSRVPYEGSIPLSLFPSWLAEIARRELVTTQQIRDVLDAEYVVTPPRPPSA